MSNIPQIEQFSKRHLSFAMRNGYIASHDIYTRGQGDKVVVIIQELPGIGQETLALADEFVDKNYTVVLPHLFGPIGKTATVTNFLRALCMRREFKIFAKNQSSPIVDFLSSLCSYYKKENQVNILVEEDVELSE